MSSSGSTCSTTSDPITSPPTSSGSQRTLSADAPQTSAGQQRIGIDRCLVCARQAHGKARARLGVLQRQGERVARRQLGGRIQAILGVVAAKYRGARLRTARSIWRLRR